jgi:hypothetical protein
MTTDQLQDLEIQRRGILVAPHTNLQEGGTLAFNGNPNDVTLASISTDNGTKLLWYLAVGSHYINYSNQEYVKVVMPTGSDMTNCWKKISFEASANGYVEKDTYNAYTVLAATLDNTPAPITLTENSVFGRIGSTIQSILLDSDLLGGTSDNHDTIPTAKAVIAYVNDQIAGALTFRGGYDVSADNTDKGDFQLQGANKPTILQGDTYVVTVGGTFFTTATLDVGDMIIAAEANPTTLAGWTLVIKNIPDIVDASTTVKGIVQLATAIDSNATKAVTPALVQTAIQNVVNNGLKKYLYLIPNPSPTTTTTFTISAATHALGNGELTITVKDIVTGEIVETDVSVNVSNDVVIKFSNPPANNKYRVIIIG